MSRAKPDPDSCAIKMTAAPPALDAPGMRSRTVEAAPLPTGPPAPRRQPIGHEEQVDEATEQRLADTRREDWDAAAPARARARGRARAAMTLGERLDEAVRGLTSASTVGAASLERVSRSAENENVPTVETPRIESNLRVIEHHVARLELLLDAERGFVRAPDQGRMTSEAKDKMIWEDFLGVVAADVASAAPYLGTSARTIRLAREREAARRRVKVNPRTGEVTGKVFEGEGDEWAA